MSEKLKEYLVFLSAAEPSADAHCAGLINALKKSSYDLHFVGVGGEKMAAAGCELLENTTGNATMAYKAFSQVWHFYRLLTRITSFFKQQKPDLVIVCDSPAFNFHVAKAAKKMGLPTLFYVAPQLWAWAPWRIGKIKKYCDRLACILPFEEQWFGNRGVKAEFVGNPLLDEVCIDFNELEKKYDDFEGQNASIALMPGSRQAEIDTLWEPMQRIALRIRRKFRNVNFTTVAVDKKTKQILKSTQVLGFGCRYEIGSVYETAKQVDLSLVASGSATLQVAAAGCPMAIMYQSSRVIWHLVGRWLITAKHLSLVNILADRKLVPEFMPYFSSIDPIAEAVESFLEDKAKLAQTSNELINLVKALGSTNASEKTAVIALEMLEKRNGN